jgi:hypothetical protein
MQPHARGGRQHIWTGARLLQIAQQPLVVEYDHDRYSPVTLYRVGCRCDVCMGAHAAAGRAQQRAAANEVFPAQSRRRLLELVASGVPVAEAATAVGVTSSRVYRRAEWDPGFAEELDEAAWALCLLGETSPQCGTASGYHGQPHQLNGRPGCRGTGCREWRRCAGRNARAMTSRPRVAPGINADRQQRKERKGGAARARQRHPSVGHGGPWTRPVGRQRPRPDPRRESPHRRRPGARSPSERR